MDTKENPVATRKRTVENVFSNKNGKMGGKQMEEDGFTLFPYFYNNGGDGNLNSFYNADLLLVRDEIPLHLQFNPYIYTGYRPLLSFWGCIQSLLYFHNETINIVTHGIPMLYMLFYWETLLPWKEIKVPILPWIHLVSSASPWIGSTVYHLFMNHNSGACCYKRLLHLDMFGIWITQSFGALTTVYASVCCLHSFWVWKILLVYSFVSLWCLYKASHARSPLERRFCFGLLLFLRTAAGLIRWSRLGGGHPLASRHIILQDSLAVLGGFIGALRIPERWIPGRFDLAANSHHIMHVIVVYAVYHMHQGAILDMKWISNTQSCELYSLPEDI